MTGALPGGQIAQGMHFSVVCSEDSPRIQPADIDTAAEGTFLSASMTRNRLRPCAFWPKARLPPEYYENTPSDLPALIFSSQNDPVTPPSWGEQVARAWKNSRHITVQGTGHTSLGAGCAIRVMSEFLNSADPATLDATCLSRVKRPPFFTGPSGPDAGEAGLSGKAATR
jgi:pimeloyl-ACP methyl ester carboxylesterase